MAIEIIPSGKTLGAEVRGVDMSGALDEATIAVIRQAWLDHLVLLFRGQELSDRDLVATAALFGELELSPRNEMTDSFGEYAPSMPEVTIISNIKVGGQAIGSLGDGEADWHQDMTFTDVPPDACFLYALELPPSGGNTSFNNMYRVYESLPEETRQRIDGRRAIHDYSMTSAGDLRKGFDAVSDVTQTPGARHPLARTHPDTDRKALFLGRRRNQYVPGLSVPESEALLDELWAHARAQEYWEHEWRIGDLIVWDNRCVMHRRDAFDPASRRLLHRTQTRGSIPV